MSAPWGLHTGFGKAGLRALLLLCGAAVAAEPLPIEYFTRSDDFGQLKISPDGAFLAATTGGPPLSALVFIDVAQMQLSGGIRAPVGDEIIDFHWVSDTRVIYSYGQRFPGREYVTDTGELFAVDRDGKRSNQIYGYRAGNKRTGSRLGQRESTKASGELLSVLEDDDKHVLIIEWPYEQRFNALRLDADAHPRIARLDVYDGSKNWVGVVPLALPEVVVDSQERVRFAVGYDADSELSVIWKPDPEGEWTEFRLPGFGDGTVTPRRFGADGHSVVLTGVAEADALEALYRVDLETRAVELLYRHPAVDIANVVTDLSGRSVVGVRFETDKPGYHWLDPEEPTARLYRMLERALPGKAIAVTSATKDGRHAVVFAYSDVSPGDYYLFDVEKKAASYLQAARSWVDPERMRPKEPIVVTARDGWTLHGYLTRPDDAPGPFPMIVLPHGGPHTVRDRWEFDWEVQLLANRGYAVLQVNFRGSAGYGREFVEAGYSEWGGRMQDDVTDATLWAIEQGLARKDAVCIYGASYGGYAALMGAVREPGLYRCAIGHAGVYDLELMFEAGDVQRWRVGRAWLQWMLGGDRELLRQRSPVHHADEIRVPVMLVHGENDWRADFEHAVRMKDALERAGKPVEWLELEGEGHGVYNDDTRRRVYEEVLAFLARHMPVEPSGSASAANSPSNQAAAWPP